MTRISAPFQHQQWLRPPTPASLLRGGGAGSAQDGPPTDKEEQDLQGEGLLGQGMGLLQGIGNVLDTGGGFVRTGLYNTFVGDSGHSAAEAAMHPEYRKYGSDFLDDAMGWKAPENWTGNDLGETISNSAQKLAHGLLGFGFDVVTDPLSLISPFGKTAQGLSKIAEAGKVSEAARVAALAGDTSKIVEAQQALKLAPAASSITQGLRSGDRALMTVHAPWWMESLGLIKRGENPLLSLGHANEVEGLEHTLTDTTNGAKIGTPIRGEAGQALTDKLNEALAQNPGAKVATEKVPIVQPSAIANAAASGLDKLSYGTFSPLRLARGLMSPVVGGTFDPNAQKYLDELNIKMQNELDNTKAANRLFEEAYDPLEKQVQDIAAHHIKNADPKFAQELLRGLQTDSQLHAAGASTQQMVDVAQRHMDTTLAAAKGAEGAESIPGATQQFSRDLIDRAIDYHTNLKKSEDWAYGIWERAGGNAPEMKDLQAAHAFRSTSLPLDKNAVTARLKDMGWGKTEFDARPEIGRNDATRHTVGNEPAINAMAQDARAMNYTKAPTDPAALHTFMAALASGDHATADALLNALPEDGKDWLRLTDKGMAQFAKTAGLSGEQSAALAALREDAAKQNAARGLTNAVTGQPLTKVELAASSLNDLRVRRLYEKHYTPNAEAAYAAQRDPNNLHLPASDPAAWLPTARETDPHHMTSGNIKKVLDPTTGKYEYQPWVRHINDGTPEFLARDYHAEMRHLNPLSPDNVKLGEDAPIPKMLKFLDGLPQEKLTQGVYDQNIAQDLAKYNGSLIERAATLRQAQNWMGREGIVAPAAAGTIKNGLPLNEVWDQSGLSNGGLETFVKDHYGQEYEQVLDGKVQAWLQKNTRSGIEPPTMDEARDAVKKDAVDSFAGTLHVHPKAVGGLLGYAKLAEAANNTPKPGPMLKLIDHFNTVFKTLAYNIWPPGHIRHIVGRATNSIMDGRAGAYDVLDHTMQAYKYISKLGKEGVEETPDFIKRFDKAKIYKNFTVEDAIRDPELLHGKMQAGGLAQALNPKGSTWKPWAIPGIPGYGEEEVAAGKPLNYLVKSGNAVQGLGDYTGQAGQFGALLKAGYSDEQAAQIVRETHYLSDLSPFEKSFLSRVVPFERFSSRNVPHQLAMLAQEPGGRTAQLVRGLTEKSAEAQQGTYVPEWMRENTAYPTGKNEKGEQGYYTNTLAPQHELNDIVLGHGLMGDIARTGEKLLSKASPLALFPIERPWSDEGRQLFTGRKIADLEKPMQNLAAEPLPFSADQPLETAKSIVKAPAWAAGHIPGIDSIMHYLPTSRLASEGERLPGVSQHGTLPQFLTNMLGLGKVSYYDTEKLKTADARTAYQAAEKLQGATPWTNYSLPKQVAARMTPQQIAAFEANRRRVEGLIHWLMQHAQQKRQQQGQQQAAAAQAQTTL